ncbi:DUF2254 domain-containing protein [Hoeflea sp.]|uniref:DUF2254 domain-containing protein n=1 Tax=Hoeflea sp. TaxID=1940281 RepID=UPI0037480058
MTNRFFFHLLQLRQRLWAKPLLYCLVAVAAVFLAHLADQWPVGQFLPEIDEGTIQTLLTIISSSMLAVATFAVGSMLQAYGAASSSATPRALTLILADDVSQTALSSFIGAFIFSIVAIVALKTGLYGRGGLFILFALTLSIFAWVVLTFVRWVDNIARLGRLESTITKVEAAAAKSLTARRRMPFLGGVEKTDSNSLDGRKIFCPDIGYVQYVDMNSLQGLAEEHGLKIMLEAMPGSFLAPGRPLVILDTPFDIDEALRARIADAFVVGSSRTFEEDPRFGLVVLSEIAARALSPAVNDMGTAIAIVGRFVRLFARWAEPVEQEDRTIGKYDRIIVPGLSLADMFDDAFTAIARDGAGSVEVGIRLQKALRALSNLDQPEMQEQAKRHSTLALQRAKAGLAMKDDFSRIQSLAEAFD